MICEKACYLKCTQLKTYANITVSTEYIKMADHYVPVPGGTNNNNYANVELILDIAKRIPVQVSAHEHWQMVFRANKVFILLHNTLRTVLPLPKITFYYHLPLGHLAFMCEWKPKLYLLISIKPIVYEFVLRNLMSSLNLTFSGLTNLSDFIFLYVF